MYPDTTKTLLKTTKSDIIRIASELPCYTPIDFDRSIIRQHLQEVNNLYIKKEKIIRFLMGLDLTAVPLMGLIGISTIFPNCSFLWTGFVFFTLIIGGAYGILSYLPRKKSEKMFSGDWNIYAIEGKAVMSEIFATGLDQLVHYAIDCVFWKDHLDMYTDCTVITRWLNTYHRTPSLYLNECKHKETPDIANDYAFNMTLISNDTYKEMLCLLLETRLAETKVRLAFHIAHKILCEDGREPSSDLCMQENKKRILNERIEHDQLIYSQLYECIMQFNENTDA